MNKELRDFFKNNNTKIKEHNEKTAPDGTPLYHSCPLVLDGTDNLDIALTYKKCMEKENVK